MEKICDMRTLLKCAKMRQSAKYVAITYLHFSDMPTAFILCTGIPQWIHIWLCRCAQNSGDDSVTSV